MFAKTVFFSTKTKNVPYILSVGQDGGFTDMEHLTKTLCVSNAGVVSFQPHGRLLIDAYLIRGRPLKQFRL